MGLQGVRLNLSGGQLSDLFFNFDHPGYERVMGMSEVNGVIMDFDSDLRKAVVDDAREFASVLGIDGSEKETLAVALADDMLARL